jgi:hypothetical protein
VFVIIPVDVNRVRITGGQTQGDLITEIRRKAGAGDAGDFGIFERVAGSAFQAAVKVEQNFVGELGYARALRIGSQVQDDFVKADQIFRLADARAAELMEQAGGFFCHVRAEPAFRGSESIEGAHSLEFSP